MLRSRSFDSRVARVGSYETSSLVPTYVTCNVGDYGDCYDDDDGWKKDNPFILNRRSRRLSSWSGEGGTGISYAKIQNLSLTLPAVTSIPSATAYNVDPNWAEVAWAAAAATNPCKPGINLPAFIGESGDIPGMLADLPKLLHKQGLGFLKRAGRRAKPNPFNKGVSVPEILAAARRAASEGGSQYVGAQFGWKPLCGDLARMLGLQQAIARMLALLLALKQGKSIKRRFRLGTQSFSVASTLNRGLNSCPYGFPVKGNWTDVYRITSWVTVRWAPVLPFLTDGLIPELSDPKGMVDLAMRLATGITGTGVMQAWWELLPWSWLVDWWMNLGTYLAMLNPLGLRMQSMCYMRTSQVTRYYAISSCPSWFTNSGEADILFHIKKERKSIGSSLILGPPPDLSLPLLSGRQWGILGGLLAQAQSRGLRR